MNMKSGMKKSRKSFVFLICLGLALIAAGVVAGFLTEDDSLGGRFFGFGSGFGSAITAVGAVFFIQAGRKPETRRLQEINEKDERLIKIREKSAYGTYYVTMLSLLAAVFVFVCLDSWVACYITLGIMLIHCTSYFVFLYRNSQRL